MIVLDEGIDESLVGLSYCFWIEGFEILVLLDEMQEFKRFF